MSCSVELSLVLPLDRRKDCVYYKYYVDTCRIVSQVTLVSSCRICGRLPKIGKVKGIRLKTSLSGSYRGAD